MMPSPTTLAYIGVVTGVLGVIGGLVAAGAAIWAVKKAERANRIAERANELSEKSNVNSEESNKIANNANELARNAMDLQIHSDRLLHSASLVLLPDFPGIDDPQPNGRFVKVPITNTGSVDAYDVAAKLRRQESNDWHSDDGPVRIPAGERRDFRLQVKEDFFRENEGGRVIDYRVTYKDRLNHHEKWFRLFMSGMWNTSWSFKLLDVKLDGTRISFPNAPELAPGIDFESVEPPGERPPAFSPRDDSSAPRIA